MSASISPDRITGAVLLVNEVFGTHSEQDAKRLHAGKWKDYIREGVHLDESRFLVDAERSELLLQTIDRVLESMRKPRNARAMRLRFGLYDGKFRTLDEVGEELDPGRKLQRERPRQLIAEGVRFLRHPTRNHHLSVFLEQETTLGMFTALQELPEPGVRRIRVP